MSTSSFEHSGMSEYEVSDHVDSLLYMNLRRIINGSYAEHPVDFNVEGILAGEKILGRPLTEADVIVDIGSNSGSMIAEAAVLTDSKATIVCAEPDAEAVSSYINLPDEHKNRISYVQASGEHLPFHDSSVDGATLHNVIFRAKDALQMLLEIKRIVRPGGFVAISSNASGHAHYRHEFERSVAEKVIAITGVEFNVPKPPAAGHYLDNLPALIKHVGNLSIVDEYFIYQDTHAVITRGGRLEDYLDSIKYSAAMTNVPGEHRKVWRQVVNFWVKPYVEAAIDKVEAAYIAIGREDTPCFADPIRRGMFVLRNNKKTQV